MDPVLEELWQSFKVGWDDRVHYYRDKYNYHVGDPAREMWEARPWWLRKKAWSKIGDDLLPNVSGVVETLRRYKEHRQLYESLATLGELYPDIFNRMVGSPFGKHSVTVRLNVEERITDIEPFMRPILEDGWEVTSTRDSFYSRDYTLKHDDKLVYISVWASVLDAERCEVIEHVETKEVEEKSYEIICEGEQELTGREL